MPLLHAWRLAAWDTPLWVSPNRSAGRFNAEGHGPVQYWSLHPLTPWAEHLRAHGIDRVERLRDLRIRAWVGRFDLDPTRVGFAQAHEYQLDPGDLVADDYTACQHLGGRLLAEQRAVALEVPSAALPGTRNLVIFGARAASPYAVDAVDDVDVPTTVTAEDGHSLEGLVDVVCYVGQPHAELAAWQEGRPFATPEPPTPLPDR